MRAGAEVTEPTPVPWRVMERFRTSSLLKRAVISFVRSMVRVQISLAPHEGSDQPINWLPSSASAVRTTRVAGRNRSEHSDPQSIVPVSCTSAPVTVPLPEPSFLTVSRVVRSFGVSVAWIREFLFGHKFVKFRSHL